jgi:hypothetical protein
VKVSHSEGLAHHTGPESCGHGCEAMVEALTGDRIGQPSSRERISAPDADTVLCVEGNTGTDAKRVRSRSGVVRDPGMCRRSLRGNREISRLAAGGRPPPVRIGKARSRSR